MSTLATTFAYKIVIYPFNSFAVGVDGFGVIRTKEQKIFSETGLGNLVGFSATLQRIHNRLLAEGYKIENGRITAPQQKSAIMKNKTPL